MARQVTIGDVAAEAGVSITTVSHALNGKGRLTDETRRRVQEVAEELGYRPSALARGLAGGRTGMLALTVSFVEDLAPVLGDYDYFMQVMNAATSAALDRGFSLTLVPAQSRAQVLDTLPLDGAIVVDPVPGDEIVDLLDHRGVPIVTTGRRPDGPSEACWVDNDHVVGTRSVIEHLASRGATRIALLTAPALQSYTIDALQAFESACVDLGLAGEVEVVTDSLSEGGAYAAASHLLGSPNPPDAIYATLDRLALGALLAAESKGIRVPDDLMVAGCTDSRAAQSSRPALTTLSLNPDVIGTEAVDLLVGLIENGAPEAAHRIVPCSLVPRASTEVKRRVGA